MSKLKCQFHCHTRQDPVDFIRHSERALIDRAAKHGYDVLAISCHNVVIFNDDLRKYAAAKRILLIPAIEKTIEKKHVLILNADVRAQNIRNFKDLRKYRNTKKACLIIAPHPFYPGTTAVKKKLFDNLDLFDGLEYSWFHSPRSNRYNEKAVKMAEIHKLPLIATSDNHNLKYLDSAYSVVTAEKNIKSIFSAIKKNRIQIISHGVPLWKMLIIYTKMGASSLLKIFIPS
jgi:predicted metal-dependent phosphoesterase TrpH